MVLVQKWPFFQFFFTGNLGQENVFYDILERENAFLGYKNKKLKESKNWYFSKGVNPWFWYKNGHFGNFFFRQYRPENYFLRYFRAKKTHGFHRKMAIFATFVLRRAWEMSFTISYNEKRPFLGIKTTT